MQVVNMDTQTIFDIRNARGLCAEEKALLFVVASRGSAWSSRETMAQDAGLSLGRFYKYRNQLAAGGLLEVQERPGETTIYRVNQKRLASMVPKDTRRENPHARPSNDGAGDQEARQELSGESAQDPAGESGHPHPEYPHQKETLKVTIQGDQEGDRRLARPSDVEDVWHAAALSVYEGDEAA